MDSKIASIMMVLVIVCFLITMPAYAGEEIIVSAAASLTQLMTEISRSFEVNHPDVSVICNFASSGALVQQMANGAPVDVFASAGMDDMLRADSKGLVEGKTLRIFALNERVMIVPFTSDASVNALSDLTADTFKKIIVGDPASVPAGRYAKLFLEAHDMWKILYDRLAYANSVRQVLDYIRRGEADAGFVYATDAAIAEKSVKIVLDADESLNISYPIAVTSTTKHRTAAVAFCWHVTGLQGRKILSAYGFGLPE